MSYRTKIYYDRNSSSELNEGFTQCHSCVQYAKTIFITVIKPEDKKNNDLKLIEEYLDFLKTIKIYAHLEYGFKGHKTAIQTDIKKTRIKFKSNKEILFAYELIRHSIKFPKFLKTVMEIHERLDKLTAWECIYLAWNSNPLTSNNDNWRAYFDAMNEGETFEYISLNGLLKRISKNQGINTSFKSIKNLKENIDVSKIKNDRLSKQFKTTAQLELTIHPFGFFDTNSRKFNKVIIRESYIHKTGKAKIVLSDDVTIKTFNVSKKDAYFVDKKIKEYNENNSSYGTIKERINITNELIVVLEKWEKQGLIKL